MSIVLGVLASWSLGEGFYRFFYRDHFMILRDLRLLPGMVNMLFSGTGGPDLSLILATYAASLLASLLIGRVFYLLVLFSSQHLPSSIKAQMATLGMFLVLAGLQYAVVPRDTPVPLLLESLIKPNTPSASVIESTQEHPQALLDSALGIQQEPEQPESTRLPDVHVFVVESYGHTLFSRDEYMQAMGTVYKDFAKVLEARGWLGVSSFLSSPAFGGRSWLADATLLAGKPIRNQEQYDNYLKSNSRNLSHRLGELGYYRILAASGTQYSTPDWEAIHEFDRYMLEKDFEYHGPFITFGRMPDQYLLYRAALHFSSRKPSNTAGHFAEYKTGYSSGTEAPLFAWYLLANSHVPFEAQPEYVEDWEALGDGSMFRDSHVRYFDNNWLWGGEFPEGYLFSIEYELKIIAEFMDRYLDPSNLVVILGDHQPRIPISEPQSSYSVPIQVLSGSAALLKPLLDQGFQQRIVPVDEAVPHRGMEDFAQLLLGILDAAGHQGID